MAVDPCFIGFVGEPGDKPYTGCITFITTGQETLEDLSDVTREPIDKIRANNVVDGLASNSPLPKGMQIVMWDPEVACRFSMANTCESEMLSEASCTFASRFCNEAREFLVAKASSIKR